MEEILRRFEYGDLRPSDGEFRRPRASRRRPGPTRADREVLRERAGKETKKQPVRSGKGKRAPRSKASRAPADTNERGKSRAAA